MQNKYIGTYASNYSLPCENIFSELYGRVPETIIIDSDLSTSIALEDFNNYFKEFSDYKSYKKYTSYTLLKHKCKVDKIEGYYSILYECVEYPIMYSITIDNRDETNVTIRHNIFFIKNSGTLKYVENLTKFCNSLNNYFYKKSETEKAKISLLTKSSQGFKLMQYHIDIPEVDIDLHYNDDFKEKHELIINNLNKLDKGFYILRGKAGTAKTTYLQYLTKFTDKTVIFIPANMVDSLTDPNFIPFLLEHKNSVLIIEEAEMAVLARKDGGRNTSVSNILNLTDGFLAKMLNIQIFVTLNTELTNIDEALTRKGRLTMLYEFNELSLEKTNKLMNKLYGKESNKPMVISDIYNYNGESFTKTKSKIGF